MTMTTATTTATTTAATAAATTAATTETTTPTPQAARERFAMRRRRSVTVLLENRSDLVGVHPLADLVSDSVRWTA